MAVARTTGVVLAVVALVWGLVYLGSPFGHTTPLSGAEVDAADPYFSDADRRCDRGGSRRLLAVGLLVGAPLLAVLGSYLVPARRRAGMPARAERAA